LLRLHETLGRRNKSGVYRILALNGRIVPSPRSPAADAQLGSDLQDPFVAFCERRLDTPLLGGIDRKIRIPAWWENRESTVHNWRTERQRRMASRRARILVLCKTYPSPSAKHTETSCVAGMEKNGNLIRLYLPQLCKRADCLLTQVTETLDQWHELVPQPPDVLVDCEAPELGWQGTVYLLPPRSERELAEQFRLSVETGVADYRLHPHAFAKAVTAMSISSISLAVAAPVPSIRGAEWPRVCRLAVRRIAPPCFMTRPVRFAGLRSGSGSLRGVGARTRGRFAGIFVGMIRRR
jgi:hypothetical protein